MMEPEISRRLAEEGSAASPKLRELLESAQGDLPKPGELDALWTKIGEGMATGITGASAAAGAGASTLGFKVVISLGIAALAGTGVFVWQSASSEDPVREVLQEEPSAPRGDDDTAQLTNSAGDNEGLRPEGSETPAAAVPVREPSTEEPPQSAVHRESPSKRKNSVMITPVEHERKEATQPSEGALLIQARTILDDNPAGALNLTRTHQELYPSGRLTQERELIAIEALVRTGEREAAEARAVSFAKSFPGSPHLQKVERISEGL